MIKKLTLNLAFSIAEFSYYFVNIDFKKIINFSLSPVKAVLYPFKAINFYTEALNLEQKTTELLEEIKANTDFDFDTIRKTDTDSLLYTDSAYSLLVKYQDKIENLKLDSEILLDNEQFNDNQMLNNLKVVINQMLDISTDHIKNIAKTIVLVQKKHKTL